MQVPSSEAPDHASMEPNKKDGHMPSHPHLGRSRVTDNAQHREPPISNGGNQSKLQEFLRIEDHGTLRRQLCILPCHILTEPKSSKHPLLCSSQGGSDHNFGGPTWPRSAQHISLPTR